MGFYLNPRGDKTEWLVKNGLEVFNLEEVRTASGGGEDFINRIWRQMREAPEASHPIVLVATSFGNAAGIAYDKRELARMLSAEDRRDKRVFAIRDRDIIELEPAVERALEPLG